MESVTYPGGLFWIAIAFAYLTVSFFSTRLPQGLICIFFVLITTVSPTIYDCYYDLSGDFVEAEVIMATPCWGSETIHSQRKQFVEIDDYVDELIREDNKHLLSPRGHLESIKNYDKNKYKSYQSVDPNGYTVIKIVDHKSQLYDQIVTSTNYYQELIDDNITTVYVKNDWSDFSPRQQFAKQTSTAAMVWFVNLLILGSYLGVFKSRHECRKEFFDDCRRELFGD